MGTLGRWHWGPPVDSHNECFVELCQPFSEAGTRYLFGGWCNFSSISWTLSVTRHEWMEWSWNFDRDCKVWMKTWRIMRCWIKTSCLCCSVTFYLMHFWKNGDIEFVWLMTAVAATVVDTCQHIKKNVLNFFRCYSLDAVNSHTLLVWHYTNFTRK